MEKIRADCLCEKGGSGSTAHAGEKKEKILKEGKGGCHERNCLAITIDSLRGEKQPRMPVPYFSTGKKKTGCVPGEKGEKGKSLDPGQEVKKKGGGV